MTTPDGKNLPVVVNPSGGARARFFNPDPNAPLADKFKFGLLHFDVAPEAIMIETINYKGDRKTVGRITQDKNGNPATENLLRLQ